MNINKHILPEIAMFDAFDMTWQHAVYRMAGSKKNQFQ